MWVTECNSPYLRFHSIFDNNFEELLKIKIFVIYVFFLPISLAQLLATQCKVFSLSLMDVVSTVTVDTYIIKLIMIKCMRNHGCYIMLFPLKLIIMKSISGVKQMLNGG